jgi:hypothetical protein
MSTNAGNGALLVELLAWIKNGCPAAAEHHDWAERLLGCESGKGEKQPRETAAQLHTVSGRVRSPEAP